MLFQLAWKVLDGSSSDFLPRHGAHHDTDMLLQRPTEDDLRSGDVVLGCYLLRAACSMGLLMHGHLSQPGAPSFQSLTCDSSHPFSCWLMQEQLPTQCFPLKVSKALAMLAALTAIHTVLASAYTEAYNEYQCFWSLALTVGSDKALAFWPDNGDQASTAMPCVSQKAFLDRMLWECHRM